MTMKKMRLKTTRVCWLVGLCLLAASIRSVASPADFVLTQIMDGATPLPGGDVGKTFDFLPPLIDGNNVYFTTTHGSLYRVTDGVTTLVAKPGDPRAPDITRVAPGLVYAKDDTVFFVTETSSQLSLYREHAGVLTRIMKLGDLLPGTTNTVTGFPGSGVFIESDGVYIQGQINGTGQSIFIFQNGLIAEIFNTHINLPAGGHPPILHIRAIDVVDNSIYILGQFGNSLETAMYRFEDTVLTRLRNITLPQQYPPPSFSLIALTEMTIDKDNVAYRVVGNGIQEQRMFLDQPSGIQEVARSHVEDRTAPYQSLDGISLQGGNLIFVATTHASKKSIVFQVGGQTESSIQLDSSVFTGYDILNSSIQMKGTSFGILAAPRVGSYFRNFRVDVVLPQADIVVEDFDGDDLADPAVFEDDIGTWFISKSKKQFESPVFGYPGITSVPGDYDGDSLADLGVFDHRNGLWYIFQTSNQVLRVFQFGYPGVEPVPSDYDGDGKIDVGVYDPTSGMWFLFKSTTGFSVHQFGYPGVLPIAKDYDGDGKSDLAVFDPNNGSWFRFLSQKGFRTEQFGYPGVVPVPADYDGDDQSDIAVYDQRNGAWYRFMTSNGFRNDSFGYPGTTAAPSDFDGDGKSDLGIYDSRTGVWYTFGTSNGFKKRYF